MNRFYIEKLVVSGGGCKTTVIDFQPGLNFILGPSNTGKSLIMDCIDYLFGFTPRKSHPSKIVDNNYVYNHTINEQIPENAQNHPFTAKRNFEQRLPVKHNF